MISRRLALRTVSAALTGGALVTALSGCGRRAQPGPEPLDPPPGARPTTSSVGKKWYADGTPKRFRGNSFVHTLDPGAPLAVAAAAIRRELLEDPLGALFTTLPPDSYHVTFLDGTDEGQREGTRWPAGVPRDLPMDEVSRRYLAQLSGSGIAAPTGLRFATAGITDIADPKKGLSVSLVPDEPSAAALRLFRSRVLQLLALDVPVDGYDFHLTIAYCLFENTPGETDGLVALRNRFAASLPPEVVIDGCSFATFENMVGFPALLPL